jgi:hypothetical protein
MPRYSVPVSIWPLRLLWFEIPLRVCVPGTKFRLESTIGAYHNVFSRKDPCRQVGIRQLRDDEPHLLHGSRGDSVASKWANPGLVEDKLFFFTLCHLHGGSRCAIERENEARALNSPVSNGLGWWPPGTARRRRQAATLPHDVSVLVESWTVRPLPLRSRWST